MKIHFQGIGIITSRDNGRALDKATQGLKAKLWAQDARDQKFIDVLEQMYNQPVDSDEMDLAKEFATFHSTFAETTGTVHSVLITGQDALDFWDFMKVPIRETFQGLRKSPKVVQKILKALRRKAMKRTRRQNFSDTVDIFIKEQECMGKPVFLVNTDSP